MNRGEHVIHQVKDLTGDLTEGAKAWVKYDAHGGSEGQHEPEPGRSTGAGHSQEAPEARQRYAGFFRRGSVDRFADSGSACTRYRRLAGERGERVARSGAISGGASRVAATSPAIPAIRAPGSRGAAASC